jgi:hypothetical protein
MLNANHGDRKLEPSNKVKELLPCSEGVICWILFVRLHLITSIVDSKEQEVDCYRRNQ